MQVAVGRACGKAILCGEHAVVYGQPAIALPLFAVGCTVEVTSGSRAGVTIRSDQFPDPYVHGSSAEPSLAFLGTAIDLAFQALGPLGAVQALPPALEVAVRSSIPIGCGLGRAGGRFPGQGRGIFWEADRRR